MASEPIRSTAITAAPKDYQIPNAQQIRLLSVTAAFIDNGAVGDWLPAVVILDNNGNALCRAVDQGVKVTAGGDAEVSWFPDGRMTGGGGGVTVAWGEVLGGDPAQSVAADPTGASPLHVDFSGGVFVESGGGPFSFDSGEPRFLQCASVPQLSYFTIQGWFEHQHIGGADVDPATVRAELVIASPIGGSESPPDGDTLMGMNNQPFPAGGDPFHWGQYALQPNNGLTTPVGIGMTIWNEDPAGGELNVVNPRLVATLVGG